MNAYFCQSFFDAPHLVESPGVFLIIYCLFSGQIHFCRWFACLFPVPGLGLAGMAIYLFAKIWERISHRLERVICIVLFILIVMWFPPISLSSLEPFSFVSCQTCGSSASVLVWTLLQVLVPKGSAVHDPKTKENKERESENMNSKGEMWKQCESQGGRHIKTGIQHETNMKKMKKNNNMNQNKKRKQKKQHIPWKRCCSRISTQDGDDNL